MKLFKTLAFSAITLVGFVAYTGTAQADEVQYTVKANDTLSSIAHTYFGSSDYVHQIAKDNHIENANLIFEGEVLTIQTDASIAVTSVPAASQTTPVAQAQPVAPVQVAPVAQAQPVAPVQTTGSESSAKEWIAGKESSGSYTATNGQYYGRYQLSSSYLNGDYSVANQERVADSYVANRYGSWSAAKSFWLANGWY